jgi:hypothetical protein
MITLPSVGKIVDPDVLHASFNHRLLRKVLFSTRGMVLAYLWLEADRFEGVNCHFLEAFQSGDTMVLQVREALCHSKDA